MGLHIFMHTTSTSFLNSLMNCETAFHSFLRLWHFKHSELADYCKGTAERIIAEDIMRVT